MNNKKYIIKTLFLLIILFGFYSCSEDDKSNNIAPELSITQDAIEVSQINTSFLAGYSMLTLKSNQAWEVSSDQSWCTVSNTSGDATLTDYQIVNLKVLFEVNNNDKARTAILTFKSGDEIVKVNVAQFGTGAVDSTGWELASTTVYNMKSGLNIGNTLDATASWITGDNTNAYETAWGNPVITKELIIAIKAGGFNAVRLPVTWWQHMDSDNKVNEKWMNRVAEVVKYITDANMYCIINVHHDTGAAETSWLRADNSKYDQISSKYVLLWNQIAVKFNSYGEKLIFEGYNELLDGNATWTSTNASGYEAQNKLAQLFVNTIRATGNNNLKRNLIINTYSADAGASSVSNFIMPTDQVENHLIAGVHIYTPGAFTSQPDGSTPPVWIKTYEDELTPMFVRLNQSFVSKGYPVLIGEFGANDIPTEAERAKYVKFFIGSAQKYGISCFYWFDIINRTNYSWKLPLIKDALLGK